MICIPILLGLWLTRKFNLGWRLFGIGAITFIASQVVHLPFNSLLNTLFLRGILPLPPAAWRLGFSALLGGLTAGVFEETARYMMYRWLAKDARSWKKGLLAGAGHGGIESILLGILFFYQFIQLIAYQSADLSKLVPANQIPQLQAVLNAFWGASWYDSLLGAVERFTAITMHLALSLLVLQVFIRHQPFWLLSAIGLHTLWDALLVYSAVIWGIHPTIGLEIVSALVALELIFLLRKKEPILQPDIVPEVKPIESISLDPVKETPENLEATRYL